MSDSSAPFYPLPKPLTVREVVHFLGDEVVGVLGDDGRMVHAVASLEAGQEGHLAFSESRGESIMDSVREAGAWVLFCRPELGDDFTPPENKTLILVSNPTAAFVHCISEWFSKKIEPGVHPTAVVGDGCHIAPSATVGPHAYVGNGVTIGEETRIDPGVRIYDGVRIGARCRIQANAVLGAEGLAYAKHDSGEMTPFPHLGTLVIGDDVDVGPGAVLIRGILKDTVIENGARLGNMVNVGHNSHVESNSFISAAAVLCGSSHIGRGAWIAPQAVIRNKSRIGAGAIVGLGAVVVRDVPPETTVAGNPAKSLDKKKEKSS